MEIDVFGSVGVYEQQARAQIEVQNVRLVQRQPFILDERTRQELEQKKLWPKAKRPLPHKIGRLGLITSQYSEAKYDFEANYKREGGGAEIEPYNIRLQGEDAAQEISNAIQKYNNLKDVDVIILMRGGGSQADLALFNDVRIAEAICRSTIPVITGIGHQRDETFADQVADLQESTPTAVAFRLARLSQEIVQSKQTPWLAYSLAAIAIFIILGLLFALLVRQ
jgi:exodeoxyribonuclease VII large subunit